MLADSPYAKESGLEAEEWAVHDYDFGGLSMGESPDLGELWNIYEAACDSGNAEAYLIYADWVGLNCASLSDFQDKYQGEYRSEKDFAESYADDTGLLDSIPESLQYYFDFEAFGRDLFINDFTMLDGGHVFSAY